MQRFVISFTKNTNIHIINLIWIYVAISNNQPNIKRYKLLINKSSISQIVDTYIFLTSIVFFDHGFIKSSYDSLHFSKKDQRDI